MHSSSGRTASTTSASPPTMIDRAAFFAPTSPPETGASRLPTPLALRRLVDLAGQRRLAGGHVHQHRARPCCPPGAPCGPRKTSRTSFGKADDGEDHVGALGHGLRRVGPGGAGVEQRLALSFAAVVDRRRVALGHQVLAHPPAHHAGADPADPRLCPAPPCQST